MAGKRDIFMKRLGPSGLDAIRTGEIVGFYGFHHYTGSHGNVYLNEKFDTPNDTIKAGGVDTSTNPLILLGTGQNRSHVSGSGHFDGQTIYSMEGDFPTEDWSMYIDFGPFDGIENRSQGKVIVSTMRSPNDTSGFNVGLNGANKVYFEYYHPSGYLQRVSANQFELASKNLISISYTKQTHVGISGYNYNSSGDILFTREDSYSFPSNLTIKHHNLANRPAAGEDLLPSEAVYFSDTDTNSSKSLYIGDFYSGNSDYTGYSGYLNNIVIFSGEGEREMRSAQIGAAFFLNEFELKTTGIQTTYEFINTGSGFYENQITGTGITGYESSIQYITGRNGSIINSVVRRSALTGALTGSALNFPDSDWGSDIVVSGQVVYTDAGKQVAIIESGGKPYAIGAPYGFYGYASETGVSGASGILSQSGVVRVRKTTEQPEIKNADSEYMSGYGYPNVVFMESIDTVDNYEIRTRSASEISPGNLLNSRIGINSSVSSPADLKQKTFINSPSEDVETVSESFSSSGGAVFINGQLQMLGNSGGAEGLNAVEPGAYYMKHGSKIYTNPGSGVLTRPTEIINGEIFTGDLQTIVSNSPDHLTFDDLFDDGISGTAGNQFVEPYYSGSGNLVLSGSQYLNKDLYMNGQKLLSGTNFLETGSTIEIVRSSFEDMATGEIIFSPSSFYSNTITGNNGSFQVTPETLYQPQIYLNGVRQTQGINYLTTVDHSLLNSQVRITPQIAILYGNESGFFNYTGFTSKYG